MPPAQPPAALVAAAAEGHGLAALAAACRAAGPRDAPLCGEAARLAVARLKACPRGHPDAPDWALLGAAAADGLDASTRGASMGATRRPPSTHAPETFRYSLARACLAAGLPDDASAAAAALLASARRAWGGVGASTASPLPAPPAHDDPAAADRATLIIGAMLTLASAAAASVRVADVHGATVVTGATAAPPWLALLPGDGAAAHGSSLKKAAAALVARLPPAAAAAAVAAAALVAPLDRVGATLADAAAALPADRLLPVTAAVLDACRQAAGDGSAGVRSLAALTDLLLPRRGPPPPGAVDVADAVADGRAGPADGATLALVARIAAGGRARKADAPRVAAALDAAASASPASAAAVVRSLNILRRRLTPSSRTQAPDADTATVAAAALCAAARVARATGSAPVKGAYGALSCLVGAVQLEEGFGCAGPCGADFEATWEAAAVPLPPRAAPLPRALTRTAATDPVAAAVWAWSEGASDEEEDSDVFAAAAMPPPPPHRLAHSELTWLSNALAAAGARAGATWRALPPLRAAAVAAAALAAMDGNPSTAEAAADRAASVARVAVANGDRTVARDAAAAAVAAVQSARTTGARVVSASRVTAAAAAALGVAVPLPRDGGAVAAAFDAAAGVAAAGATGDLPTDTAWRVMTALAASAPSRRAAAAVLIAGARLPPRATRTGAACAAAAAGLLDQARAALAAVDAGIAHATAALVEAGGSVAERAPPTPPLPPSDGRVGEAAAEAAAAAAARHAAAACPSVAAAAVAAVVDGDDGACGDETSTALAARADQALAAWRRAGHPRAWRGAVLPLPDVAALATDLAAALALVGRDAAAAAVAKVAAAVSAEAGVVPPAALTNLPAGPLLPWALAPAPVPALVAASADGLTSLDAVARTVAVSSEPTLAAAASAAADRGDAAAATSLRCLQTGAALRRCAPAAALAAAGDGLRAAAATLEPLLGGTTTPPATPTGWWAALALYLPTLLLTCTACDAAGASDDALAAAREGGALAAAARARARLRPPLRLCGLAAGRAAWSGRPRMKMRWLEGSRLTVQLVPAPTPRVPRSRSLSATLRPRAARPSLPAKPPPPLNKLRRARWQRAAGLGTRRGGWLTWRPRPTRRPRARRAMARRWRVLLTPRLGPGTLPSLRLLTRPRWIWRLKRALRPPCRGTRCRRGRSVRRRPPLVWPRWRQRPPALAPRLGWDAPSLPTCLQAPRSSLRARGRAWPRARPRAPRATVVPPPPPLCSPAPLPMQHRRL